MQSFMANNIHILDVASFVGRLFWLQQSHRLENIFPAKENIARLAQRGASLYYLWESFFSLFTNLHLANGDMH